MAEDVILQRTDVAASSEPGISLLILQPTPFCNIDCKYCYLPARNQYKIMSEEVLCTTLQKVFNSNLLGEKLSVVWHVGEPLSVPVSFYENAFSVCNSLPKPVGLSIRHGFQTNGTLMTDEWCSFIRQNDVSIGISIDGPRSLHDANRVARSGRGTFDETMRGIRLLQRHGINFNVISVVHRTTLSFPDEWFQFFEENGIEHVCFNIEEIEGANKQTSLQGPVEVLFRQFVERVFHLYKTGNRVKSLREYDDPVYRAVHSLDGPLTNTQTTPLRILAVDHLGNFSTFAPELLGMTHDRYGDFVFGNILRDDLETSLQTDKFRRIHEDINSGVEQCRRECGYFSVCGGGSPSNKLFENGTFNCTETLFCRLTRKILTDVALGVFEDRARRNAAQ